MKVLWFFLSRKNFFLQKEAKTLINASQRLVGPFVQGWPTTKVLVGQGGFEPPTPRLSSVCSNQLSYWPKYHRTAATTYQMTRSNTSLLGSSRGRDMLMAPNSGQT